MIQPITIHTQQEHTQEVRYTGEIAHEQPGIDIAATFTPEGERAAKALREFDAAVAEVRRGIAVYAEEGE